MDLIDRDAAISAVTTELAFHSYAGNIAANAIKSVPSAEKRGKWVKDEQESLKHIEAIYRCSACNNFEAWGETEKYNYCPYCGARMESEE